MVTCASIATCYGKWGSAMSTDPIRAGLSHVDEWNTIIQKFGKLQYLRLRRSELPEEASAGLAGAFAIVDQIESLLLDLYYTAPVIVAESPRNKRRSRS
jgi:hypothetical protein